MRPELLTTVTDWSGLRGSLRLAAALPLLIALMALATLLQQPQEPAMPRFIAALLICFAAYAVALLYLYRAPRVRELPAMQDLLISVCMLLYALTSGWLAELPGFAVVFVLPALHAALRLGQRDAWLLAAGCALAWVLVRGRTGLAEWTALAPLLVETLPLLLTVLVVQTLVNAMSRTQRHLSRFASRDELTGVLNMRAFQSVLEREHQAAVRAGGRYALLMVDIDGLQRFNDDFGYEQGSRVLNAVADALQRSVRSADLVARYGGDEFLLYLADTDDAVAEQVCKRISQNVYNITLSFGRTAGRVQVSVGCAIFPDSGTTVQQMMNFASQAMYRDKEFRQRQNAPGKDPQRLRDQAGVRDLL